MPNVSAIVSAMGWQGAEACALWGGGGGGGRVWYIYGACATMEINGEEESRCTNRRRVWAGPVRSASVARLRGVITHLGIPRRGES